MLMKNDDGRHTIMLRASIIENQDYSTVHIFYIDLYAQIAILSYLYYSTISILCLLATYLLMVGILHISSNYSLTLAINVTRLDAVPPGAQPTSINPIDN